MKLNLFREVVTSIRGFGGNGGMTSSNVNDVTRADGQTVREWDPGMGIGIPNRDPGMGYDVTPGRRTDGLGDFGDSDPGSTQTGSKECLHDKMNYRHE